MVGIERNALRDAVHPHQEMVCIIYRHQEQPLYKSLSCFFDDKSAFQGTSRPSIMGNDKEGEKVVWREGWF